MKSRARWLGGALFLASLSTPVAAQSVAMADPVKPSPAADVQEIPELAALPLPAPQITPAATGTSPAHTKPGYLRADPARPGPVDPAETESSPFRAWAALLVVGALGGAALYLRRRKNGPAQLRHELALHVLGSVPVGPKANVVLLSVGQEALLIGVSEHGVSALRTFGKDELGALTNAPPELERHPRADVATASIAPDVMGASQVFRDLLLSASRSPALASQANLSPSQAARNSQDDDVMPPHLAEALRQSSAALVTKSASEPLRAIHDDAFSEPEGQATELVRRFRGLHS